MSPAQFDAAVLDIIRHNGRDEHTVLVLTHKLMVETLYTQGYAAGLEHIVQYGVTRQLIAAE